MTDNTKPARDGIAEILASGRFPGFVVRGSDSAPPLEVELSPAATGVRDVRKRKKLQLEILQEKKEIARKKKRLEGLSRKRDGAIRHIASVPLEVDKALREKHGDDYVRGDARDTILKDYGFNLDS